MWQQIVVQAVKGVFDLLSGALVKDREGSLMHHAKDRLRDNIFMVQDFFWRTEPLCCTGENQTYYLMTTP